MRIFLWFIYYTLYSRINLIFSCKIRLWRKNSTFLLIGKKYFLYINPDTNKGNKLYWIFEELNEISIKYNWNYNFLVSLRTNWLRATEKLCFLVYYYLYISLILFSLALYCSRSKILYKLLSSNKSCSRIFINNMSFLLFSCDLAAS